MFGGAAARWPLGDARRRTPALLIALVVVSLAVVAAVFVAAVADTSFVTAHYERWPAAGAELARASSRTALRSASSGEKVRPPSEWRLRVGRALDVLRSDIVALFDVRELVDGAAREPDFSIFSEDIEFVDARLPSFQLRGLKTYKQFLSTLRWSLRAACSRSYLEITAMQPPINNEAMVRWRLKLWPHNVLEQAKGNFKGFIERFGMHDLGGQGTLPIVSGFNVQEPVIIEGYSKYMFHPWSAEIVKHTIDITNPPMYIEDLIQQYTQYAMWPRGVAGVPSMMYQADTVPVPVAAGGVSEAKADVGRSSHVMAASGLAASNAAAATGRLAQGSTFTGSTASKPRHPEPATSRPAWTALFGNMPQRCEDDFECNDGKANHPLQCCELPIFGNYCCEPEDFEPGLRAPAYEPIPVPIEDPWQNRG